jgi:nicotinate dehydrogenase subunit B
MAAIPVIQEVSSSFAEATNEGRCISDWLQIGTDGVVTVFCGKVEVGQGSRTSLRQIVAGELSVPLEMVVLVLGDTALTPFDQGTFGSRTTATMGVQLRDAAASLRDALRQRAAADWSVEPDTAQARDGVVCHIPSGRRRTYAELGAGKRFAEAVTAGLGSPAVQWTVAGTPVPKANAVDIVTGRHRYTPDLNLCGMRQGRVLRPPRFGAELRSLDATAALAIPGVTVVHDGEFVGVAAPDARRAAQALAALRAEWSWSDQPSDRDLEQYLRTHLDEQASRGRPAAQTQDVGDVDRALASAPLRSEATYTTAYIAHVPMEPRAALATWQGDHLTVWTGTQRPFGVRGQLAGAFGVPEAHVRVVTPDTGSAYGGKHTGEPALEAARLARQAGQPVKIVWTREEEFRWAYLRPAAVIDIRSAVGEDGRLLAWEFHNYNAGPGAIRSPYAAENQRVAYHPVQSPLRQGSYRALAATANIFARETHMDELAQRLGLDPLAFRLRNLTDDRLRAVLTAAAERFRWAAWHPEAQRGIGLACGTEKGGYVACCVEVAVDRASRRVNIVRVVQAYECGAIVNPANVQRQVEGAIIQGLGGALYERIEFAGGRILNPRFSRYRVPRFADVPPIDTVLLNRPDLPSAGAGETPITAIAPAVGNAIFAACGVRLRALPMLPAGVLPV